MNGEIDFREALLKRVETLKGVRLSDLQRLILNIPYTPWGWKINPDSENAGV